MQRIEENQATPRKSDSHCDQEDQNSIQRETLSPSFPISGTNHIDKAQLNSQGQFIDLRQKSVDFEEKNKSKTIFDEKDVNFRMKSQSHNTTRITNETMSSGVQKSKIRSE